MTGATFPLDPADIPTLKRWLTVQDDPQGARRRCRVRRGDDQGQRKRHADRREARAHDGAR